MAKEENILTIEDNGNVKFTDGNIKVDNVTEKSWNDIKEYIKHKRHINDEIKLAEAAVKNADNDVTLKLANERLKRATDFKTDLITDFKAKIKRLHNERTELADSFNDPILSPLIALLEGYYRKRKQILANLPDDRILVTEEIQKLLEQPTLEDKQAFLEAKGLPCKKETLQIGMGESGELTRMNENSELTKQNKSILLLVTDKNGNNIIIPITDANSYQSLIENEDFKNKISEASALKTYTVDSSELLTNITNLSMAADKKAAIEKLSSATLVQDLNRNSHTSRQSTTQSVDDYNKSVANKLMPHFNSSKHTIDPNKVNWSEVALKGINVSKLSAEDIDKMLSGKPTGLVPTLSQDKNGNIIKGQARLAISRNEHGVISIASIKALDKANIPDKIFDYTLSEKEKQQLAKNGRLSKAITITVANQKKTIIPFIDSKTNQLMFRDVDKLKLPMEHKGVKLSDKHVKALLQGETVAIAGLLDNQGVPFNGFARINPATGKIEDVPVANLEHRLQVAANNHGNRTESLAHDKDTTIHKGQQKNNDAPKPKIKAPKFKLK